MELPKIDLKYLREAFKEPINFWGMAGFAVAAAYVQDVTPLVAALATKHFTWQLCLRVRSTEGWWTAERSSAC